MSEQENLKKVMLLGIENTTSLKECIKYEIMLIFVSIPLIVFNIVLKKYIFLTLSILPAILHLLCAVKFMSGRKIEGIREILYSGISLCCLSFISGLGGIEILIYLLEGTERIIMISMVCVSYVLVLKFYKYIVGKQIDKMSESKTTQKGIWMPLASCGALGMSTARIFAKDADNGTILVMLFICCMIISYVCLFGIINIYKYRYIMKHKEILDEIR